MADGAFPNNDQTVLRDSHSPTRPAHPAHREIVDLAARQRIGRRGHVEQNVVRRIERRSAKVCSPRVREEVHVVAVAHMGINLILRSHGNGGWDGSHQAVCGRLVAGYHRALPGRPKRRESPAQLTPGGGEEYEEAESKTKRLQR